MTEIIKHDVTKPYWEVEIQLNASLNLAQNAVQWTASPPGRFTYKTQVIQTAKHTSSAHLCCCCSYTADCTQLNVIQLCFMADRKVGPNCGKLTQLADTMQVQNINMLLQLTLHSSASYTQSTPTHFQQFFCLLEPDISSKQFIKLLYCLMKENKAQHIWCFVGIIVLL